jgi:DNA-directed RNA polymerase subunit omega
MRQPTIDVLLDQLDSKYGLVVATSKRARALTDGAKATINYSETDMKKPVSIALNEIGAGNLRIDKPTGGIK